MAGKEYFNTAHFVVDIQGLNAKQFSAVEGLGMEIERISHQQGATKIRESRKGRTLFRDITLKRQFDGDRTLIDWFQRCSQGSLEKKNGSIILKDDNDKDVLRFNFTNAWPISYVAPEFNVGGTSSIALEQIVLDVESVEIA